MAWTSGACPIDGTSLACNDDSIDLQSALVLEGAEAGTTYYIIADSFDEYQAGTLVLDGASARPGTASARAARFPGVHTGENKVFVIPP